MARCPRAIGHHSGTAHDEPLGDDVRVSTVVALSLVGPAESAEVGGGWGRAQRIAIATVVDGDVTDWVEHDVRWDLAHDEGSEGSHHARVVRFLMENGVEVVATGHMGPPMARMLGTMGIRAVTGVSGDPRKAAVAAAQD